MRDIEDPGDLLGDDGKELIRRRFASNEGRDLPQGGLFGDELPSALLRALERLDAWRTWRRESRVDGRGTPHPDRAAPLGDRPVVQNDIATTLWDVEWARVPRPGAIEHVAVAVDEQIRAPRHEIAVPTSEPSVLIAADLQEALLHSPGSGGRRSRLRGCATFQRLERSTTPMTRPDTGRLPERRSRSTGGGVR